MEELTREIRYSAHLGEERTNTALTEGKEINTAIILADVIKLTCLSALILPRRRRELYFRAAGRNWYVRSDAK